MNADCGSRRTVRCPKRVWIAAVAVIAGVVCVGVCFLSPRSLGDPVFSRVRESDIVSARVGSFWRIRDGALRAETHVFPSVAYRILSALMPNRVDPRPAEWAVMGVLEFTLDDGKTYWVTLFSTDDNEAAFKVGDVYYRGGSDAELMRVMREVAGPIAPGGETVPEQGESDGTEP